MNVEKALEVYQFTNRRMKALHLAFFLEGWDRETLAPRISAEARAAEIGTLSEMSYELTTSPEYLEAIEVLFAHREELSAVLAHEVTELKKQGDRLARIPQDKYVAYSELSARAFPVYVDAKRGNNWAAFAPMLEQILAFQKEYSQIADPDLVGYDLLLDEYEPEYGQKEYDEFFDLIKRELVPLVAKIRAKGERAPAAWTKQRFPIDKQKHFAEYLRTVMCFNPACTVMAESEHPFTSNFGRKDVRITNHFHEDDFLSAIFSAIHEMGHGMYERQVSAELDNTMSDGGASMAMHESQSRFFENMIGRSLAFWQTHMGALKEIFPEQLADVSAEDMYREINRVECSLIRTEADEVTYPLHVLIRYELEKELLSGRLAVEDLPAAWNAKYKEYLGVDVPNDSKGVLQDVHWAHGSFGYFPTYALGSAYAAQMYAAMGKDLDIETAMRQPTLKAIGGWLAAKVHTYGASRYPKQILREATGEDFDPHYFLDYLKEKYTALYNL